LTGLAIASKVTVIPLVPFVVLLVLDGRPARVAVKTLGVFLGAAFVGCVVGCPYVWTDPIRLAKTIVGNASRKGAPPGLVHTLGTAVNVVPIWLWLGMVLTFAVCLKRRR